MDGQVGVELAHDMCEEAAWRGIQVCRLSIHTYCHHAQVRHWIRVDITQTSARTGDYH